MIMTDHPGLAEKALSSAEQHGRSLKAVNEKLTELVSSLRDQRRHLEEFSQSAAPAAGGGGAPTASDSTPGTLAAELAQSREAVERRREHEERLRQRLAEIEAENKRLCDDFVAVQEQNSELVNLYAAIERLHGAPDRAEVLAAIQEIVVNMVGSEEMVLFELAPDARRLVPAHAFGVESDVLREVEVGSGPVGRAAAEGRTHVAREDGAPASPEDPHLTACVPLKLGTRVTGALAIYRLLSHKPTLTDFDRELFALLEKHAALALHVSGLRERIAGGT